MNAELSNKMQQLTDQNLLRLEQYGKTGKLVVGFYCIYSPVELAIAAGTAVVSLCGTKNDPIAAAEEILPRNLCPLIKSSFGFAATKSCPFFQAAGLIVGDATCDGKKKMFELMDQYRPTHVMQMPQEQHSKEAMQLWRMEIERLKERIEEYTKETITEEKLRNAIKLMNRERSIKKQLMDIGKQNPTPLRGSQLLEILFKIGFLLEKEEGIACIEDIMKQLATEKPQGGKRKRILLSGVPIGLGSDKVVNIIEQCGADVVAFENCTGYKKTFQVSEQGDLLQNLAEEYLKIPCSVMSPNPGRFDLLEEMIREFQVDGVVDLTWQACHTYNIEAHNVEHFIEEKFSIPSLHLETDYAMSDTEQLRVRIEAYLEML